MPRRSRARDNGAEVSKRTPRGRRKDPQVEEPSTPTREATGSMMPQDRLPMIGSSGSKPAAKPTMTTHQRPSQAARRKRTQTGQTSANLPQDSMTPWGGLSLSESSFTSIPPPPPAPLPTPLPPQLPRHLSGGVGVRSPAPSPPVTAPTEGSRAVRVRRRVPPQHRLPRAPRLPPLRPVTNLSFSRSFTFSFFELPLHQSPHSRAERVRDLMLLLRQIQY
ncbi:WAS/WASL-interacting protein family member 3 [Oncorhynchus mykiss]|uniref:WAS/WASL-interacting protein family member 3 n=1 Tax=Oncorhynchus mykiss TaxID=8022 RepID=UPI0018781735|nr:WAS/WASL-interacting protein family member 3 [Oncorhynchus mykiss]